MRTTQPNLIIGEHLIEPQLNRITGPKGIAVVEPKVMHVLTFLASHPGEVLTKDALIEEVWTGTVVTDYVVSRSISQLRKIFGDSFKDPRYIETVSKTGYRLIAPVSLSPDDLANTHPILPSGDSQSSLEEVIEVVPNLPKPASSLPISPPSSRSAQWVWITLAAGILFIIVWSGNQLANTPSPSNPLPASLFTSTPGLELSPVFSPDGSMIVFMRFDKESRNDLYVKMIDSDTELRLTDHPASDMYPSWSSDGQHIYFQRFQPGMCEIYQISAFGGPEKKWRDCENGHYYFNVSPDEQSYLVTEPIHDFYGNRITLKDGRSFAGSIITTPPKGHSDFLPLFSPDGLHIAFSRGPQRGIADLYLVPLSGGEPQRLTFDNRYIAGHTWAPDGRSILFSSNRTGNFRLWRVNVSSGALSWVSNVATLDPGGPALSPTGKHLAFEEWTFEINIWEVDIEQALNDENPLFDSRSVRRFASTRSDLQPDYSPDGQRVAFVSNRSGHSELWISEKSVPWPSSSNRS